MKYIILILLLAVIAVAGVWTAFHIKEGRKETTTVISKTTLEKVLDISELSTGKAVYHGIAHVYDPKNDERVLYHVAYDATVKAGIDTDKIKIKIEKEAKKVTVTLPEVQIQDIDVDMGTLDYMFESKRSQTESVSKDAYQAAIADVTKECKDNEEIKDLAKENAKKCCQRSFRNTVSTAGRSIYVRSKIRRRTDEEADQYLHMCHDAGIFLCGMHF